MFRSRNFIFIMATIVLGLAFAFGLQAKNCRTPQVLSEPLDCYVQSEKLVCFDQAKIGPLNCESVDDSTVICSAR